MASTNIPKQIALATQGFNDARGPHSWLILIALADGSVRSLTGASATTRLGPAPLGGSLANDDRPVAGAVQSQRGDLWSVLLTPNGGEIAALD